MGQKAPGIGMQAISMILMFIKVYIALVMSEWADIYIYIFNQLTRTKMLGPCSLSEPHSKEWVWG